MTGAEELPGICCIWYLLYLGYVVLGTYCIWDMLYLGSVVHLDLLLAHMDLLRICIMLICMCLPYGHGHFFIQKLTLK